MRPRAAVAAAASSVFLCCLLGTAPLPAQTTPRAAGTGFQPRAVWVDWCVVEVERRIRTEHPHTSQIEATRGPVSEWAWSRTQSAVSGSGRMLRGKVWDEFDYICLIDERAGRVSELEWSGPLADGEPVRPGTRRPARLLTTIGPDEGPARVCTEAAFAAIRADHPSSGGHRVDGASLRQWQRSVSETGVRGEGVFTGRRGRPHEFEFGCVWNPQGTVQEVFYELQ